MSAAVEARFWTKVDVPMSAGGCWTWTACVNSSGYGQFTGRPGTLQPAHRFAYEMLIGPIPDGLVIDHLCRNRGCVNPTHMELVTNAENVLRGVGITARQARQTHCKRGHEFTPENTRVRQSAQPARVCRTCAREWMQRTRTRQLQEGLAA